MALGLPLWQIVLFVVLTVAIVAIALYMFGRSKVSQPPYAR
jgi:hypothetical protein